MNVLGDLQGFSLVIKLPENILDNPVGYVLLLILFLKTV